MSEIEDEGGEETGGEISTRAHFRQQKGEGRDQTFQSILNTPRSKKRPIAAVVRGKRGDDRIIAESVMCATNRHSWRQCGSGETFGIYMRIFDF